MQIPNYEILEPIGDEGGFAIVYKARRKNDSLLVAIKVPDKDFVKELAVWLNLNHPNIVKLLDYGINPRPYMVMELMNGTLHGKTFDKDTATRIILDVLSRSPSFPVTLMSPEIIRASGFTSFIPSSIVAK